MKPSGIAKCVFVLIPTQLDELEEGTHPLI